MARAFSPDLEPCFCAECERVARWSDGARQLRLQTFDPELSGDGFSPVPVPTPDAPAGGIAGVSAPEGRTVEKTRSRLIPAGERP